MNKTLWILLLTILGFVMMLTNSCSNVDGTITDIDGNVYKTVKIGTQTWMAENLKTTKYRNGDPIPNVTDSASWTALKTGAYCNYKNDTSNASSYGRLYNWYAVNTGILAPQGWHVPSDEEWSILIDYLGGEKKAGGKMKVVGTSFWAKPNKGANNRSGFTALPGGARAYGGKFSSIGRYGYWWSSSEFGTRNAWERGLDYGSSRVHRDWDGGRGNGYSVRCVRD